MLFENMRNEPMNLLEIGLSIEGPEHDAPSTRMWKSYFPNATIFGVDILDFSAFETDWFKFFKVDCSDEKQLDVVVAKLRDAGVVLDIIVDDGSHASYHQQLTMLKLFPLLRVGGSYIIEDLNWQPTVYEKKLPSVPKTSSLLLQFVQSGGFVKTGRLSRDDWQSVVSQIGAIFIIDEDYLLHLRRGYNLLSGVQALEPSYLEMRLLKRLLRRKHVRRVYGQARNLFRILITGITPVCAGRIALAIVQKKHLNDLRKH